MKLQSLSIIALLLGVCHDVDTRARADESVVQRAPAGQSAWVPDQLIVGFTGVPAESDLNRVGRSVAVRSWQGFKHAPTARQDPRRPHPLACVKIIDLAAGTDVLAAAERIKKLPGVSYVHPNYYTHAAFAPDDPFYEPEQYGLHIMRMEEAWEYTLGDPDVVIAIADSGLLFTHLDFQLGAVWTNPGEIPGNGIDDDGNGFVDDVRGWDFMNSDDDPSSSGPHGQHVAGIAAARINNGIGVAGTANCRIMVLQVFNNLLGTWASIANAITYAVDNGANVVNYSGGGSGGAAVIADAVAYAHANNVTVVCAAGNDGAATSFFPGAYAETIAVSATGENDVYYTNSNRGPWVDVAAPGIAIFSAWNGNDNDYRNQTGTSMATAYVTGLVALMVSLDPTLQVEEIRSILHDGAVDLGAPGFDEQFGWGRIDAKATLDRVMDRLQRLRIDYPDGVPAFVPPGEEVVINVTITDALEMLDPVTPTAHWRYDDGPFADEALLNLGEDQFQIVLPEPECGQFVEFYVTAETTKGTVVSSPVDAPNELFQAHVGTPVTQFDDDFEFDLGWTSTFEGKTTTGQWVREDPIGTAGNPRPQTEDDFSEDGTKCYVTGNCEGAAGACDVDDGPVILTSPAFDLSEGEWQISYARWFFDSQPNDFLYVEISNDDGANWVELETLGPGGPGGWEVAQFVVADFIEPSEAVRVRFVTEDANGSSLLEAAVDEFKVSGFVCSGDATPPRIVHDGVQTWPFSGYIDPRSESSDGVALDRGINQVIVTFSEPVRNVGTGPAGEITASAFTLTGTAASYPVITSVEALDDVSVRLQFSEPIPIGVWTTIIADVEDQFGNRIENLGDLGPGMDEPDRLDIGFLPCDVDQNRIVQPLDLLRFRQIKEGTFHHPLGSDADYADIDRSGVIEPLDLLRFRQLYVGTGSATRAWVAKSLDPQP